MNVLQVLATTSILFVLFATVWVMYVEEWLEQREVDQTRRGGDRTELSSEDPVEQTQSGGN